MQVKFKGAEHPIMYPFCEHGLDLGEGSFAMTIATIGNSRKKVVPMVASKKTLVEKWEKVGKNGKKFGKRWFDWCFSKK